MKTFLFISLTLLALISRAESGGSNNLTPVLVDLQAAQEVGIKTQQQDLSLQVGFAQLNSVEQERLHAWAHENNRCGAFEVLRASENISINKAWSFDNLVSGLREQEKKNQISLQSPIRPTQLIWNADIQKAIEQMDEIKLKAWVQYLADFGSRSSRLSDPNIHVNDLQQKILDMVRGSQFPIQVSLISHTSTKQKSIRVRITGKDRPQEIIVLGAHLDSINQMGGSSAPGVDDNASGSANLLEALRVLSAQAQPERTVDFFWYAAEELGLLGSSEIAQDYKKNKQDVVAAMQLDMTLYPGEGEMVLGNFTDFTSVWLQDYFTSLAQTYLKVSVVTDRCGYGCSDHASWYRQGYSTLFPFEAKFKSSNPWIHTPNDKMRGELSFKHALEFSKVALIFAMDLGGSTERGPVLK